MSRCFPFPPPGYEKKPKSGEHGDLLAKEKHKEKKHKKEDKERRDRDKSKDKQKEKKERKEKHRDKKDKDRDKERNKTSEDQRTEIHREDKLEYDSRKADEFRDSKFTEELGRRIRHEEQGATNRMVEDISATPNTGIESTGTSTAMVNKMSTNVPVTIQRNEKLTPLFHKRTEVMEISTTTEKQKATSGEKVHDTGRRRNEYLIPQVRKRTETMGNATAMEKQRAANDHKVSDRTNLVERTEGMFTVNSIQRERVAGNTLVSNAIGSSTKRNDQAMENLQSIPRRIENVGAAPAAEKGRFVFPNVIGNEQRKAEGMGPPVEKGAEKKTEGKEKSKEKKAEDDKKEEGHKDRERKAEGMGLPVEKGADKKTEGKEKSKEKKAEDDKKEGHKDRERKEKKRKEKDKNRDEEKKKEEKKREKREHKRSKHDKLNENELKDHIPKLNHMTLAPHVENINAAGADGTNKRKEIERIPDGSDGPNKKRKEFEMNGFLHEPQHNGCPSKLPRTSVASFHPLVKNGRPTEFASGCSPIKLGGINNTKVVKDLDNNGKHINGMVDVQPSPVRKPRIPPVVASSSKVAVQPSPRLKPLIPPVVDSAGKAAVQPSAVRKSPIPPVDSSSKAAVRPSPLPEPPIPADVQSNGKAAIEPSPVLKPPIPSAVDSSVKVAVQSSPVRKPPIHPVVQPSSRPPHRDTKYLSTIYTVPKMEELSESEDLDWLFNDKKPPSTTKVVADGTPPQVGAMGLQIESADVFALPYVIPY